MADPKTLSIEDFQKRYGGGGGAPASTDAPAAMSMEDFQKRYGHPGNLPSTPDVAAQKPTEGSALGRFASGAFDVAKGIVGGIGSAINAGSSANPYDKVEFGRQLLMPSVEQAQKAKELWHQGEHTEALGHGVAAAIPGVGPAAAHAAERIGGSGPKYNKYGSIVEQGQAPDVAGGMGEATALSLASSPRNAIDPAISGLETAADRMGVPEALERSAGKSYRKMLTPTAKDVVPEAEAIAGGPSEKGPTGLVKNRPVAGTRAGMQQQMQGKMQEYGPQASTVYNDKPPLDPQPIIDHLERLRQQKAVVRGTGVVSDPQLNSAIDELQQNINDMRHPDGTVDAVSLDDFKDKLNRGLVSPKGHMRALSPQTSSAIEKSTAGIIGKYLDTAYPDAAAVNAQYRTAKGTNTFLEEQRRAEIAAESGVRTGSSSGFGAALKRVIPAPLRGIPNAVSALTDSVAWDSVAGATKAKIAELIRGGSYDTAAEMMKPLPKLLMPPSRQMPSGPDASFVRGVQGMNQPPNPARAITQGDVIPPSDFKEPVFGPVQGHYPNAPNPRRALPPARTFVSPKYPAGEPSLPTGATRSNELPPAMEGSFARGVNAPINPKTGIPWTADEIKSYLASLPKYAKGGIIKTPTLLSDLKTGQPKGIMAEEGPEEIKPLAQPNLGGEITDLNTQLDELTGRKRRAVLIPSGTFPRSIPDGMAVHVDNSTGNKIAFNPNLIGIHDIKTAVAMKRLTPILGRTHSPSAMTSLKHIMKQSRKASRSLTPKV